MSYWTNQTILEIETFILKGTGITDPEHFAHQHSEYLISTKADPREAARWWHWQKDKCFPGEGWISFKLDDLQIMPLDAWTNVDVFWCEMVDVIEQYVTAGVGTGHFSEETSDFSLARKGDIAIFELRGSKYPVAPDAFLHAVLGAAQEFYEWAIDYVGGFDKTYAERIAQLLADLHRRN